MEAFVRLGTAVTVVSIALLTSAQAPGHKQGGGKCTTDWDCSLGGECTSGVCVCDPWFTGDTCALLNLQAPNDTDGGTCGSGFESYYSWGGRPAGRTADGTYHIYASFMCNHKNLGAWTSDSSSAHFTSKTPAGRYEWSPEQCDEAGVCVPTVVPWSHNTVPIVDPNADPSARWQVWHIGDGIVPPKVWGPCFNKSDVGPHTTDSTTAADSGHSSVNSTGPNPGNSAYVTFSATPNGPWTTFNNDQPVPINFTGSWTQGLAGNPAPLVLPDGSINLYFTAVPCPPNSGALASNCIAVAKAKSWEGPFEMNAAQHPITYPESEDPSVFRDPRGNYHLLTNVNTCHRRCPQGVECGGHAWSRDGVEFSNLTIGAFGPYITLANGTGWANAYVERPLVLQDDNNVPIAFYVGMGRTQYLDSCNWPQLFCTGAPGEKCGPTVRPPPPPAPPPVELRNGGMCLGYDVTEFPCSGSGRAAGCPVTMVACGGEGTKWAVENDNIFSAWSPDNSTQLALDVDCNAVTPNTVVKVLASGPASLTVDSTAGVIRFTGGACLNAGQGVPRPVCGPSGEKVLPNQIKTAPCSDPTAQGWSIHSL